MEPAHRVALLHRLHNGGGHALAGRRAGGVGLPGNGSTAELESRRAGLHDSGAPHLACTKPSSPESSLPVLACALGAHPPARPAAAQLNRHADSGLLSAQLRPLAPLEWARQAPLLLAVSAGVDG